MNITNLNDALNKEGITVNSLESHGKASEAYANVEFSFADESYSTLVPYYYRRTGLFIDKESDLIEYLISIKDLFSKESRNQFILDCKAYSKKELSGKKTTRPFFDSLLNLEWNSVKDDLPNNPNWARRIQDIKEFGFTLATDTNMLIKDTGERGTHIRLIPIPRGGKHGYEIFSKAFKKRAIKVLGSRNEYDLSKGSVGRLLLDHKFPEIRWDENTKAVNSDDMSEEEIIAKFQLLDNQRNLQKREVCRKCFQTGKRGTLFGIDFFYEGDINWPKEIPKVGAEAEAGCRGCGWYDVREWRKAANNKI